MPKEYHEVLQLMAARYPEIQKRGEGVYVHETHSPARSFEQLMHLRIPQDVHSNFFCSTRLIILMVGALCVFVN